MTIDERKRAELEWARPDWSRESRCALPEVIYAEGKSHDQVVELTERHRAAQGAVLATRVSPTLGARLSEEVAGGRYYADARVWSMGRLTPRTRGTVAIATAGTSDQSVAEEAARCLEWMAVDVSRHYDIGVAGLHRIEPHLDALRGARVTIVVAGMDGALPTVVAGLVPAPVVAVPTSVGYGAAFEGLASLLTMLNGCAPGIAVVNIDNGFGAAALAFKMLAQSTAQSD